jgi:hypothetical protein
LLLRDAARRKAARRNDRIAGEAGFLPWGVAIYTNHADPNYFTGAIKAHELRHVAASRVVMMTLSDSSLALGTT